MQTTTITITGMMCQACVGHVSKALRAVPGVNEVEVDLEIGRAVVRHDGSDLGALTLAVDEEGYQASIAAWIQGCAWIQGFTRNQ